MLSSRIGSSPSVVSRQRVGGATPLLPLRCLRKVPAVALPLLPGGQPSASSSACNVSQHALRLAPAASTSGDAAALQLQQPAQHTPDVFDALRRCRTLLSCLAFCAVYGFLSSGAVSSLPFASVAMAAGESGHHGETSYAAGTRGV